MNNKETGLSPKGITLLVLGAVVLYWGLNHLLPIWNALQFLFGLIFPFILGCGLAFLLNIPMRPIERLLQKIKVKHRGWIRPVALLITLLCVIGVIAGVMWVVVPQVAETGASVRAQFPAFLRSTQEWLSELAVRYPDLGSASTFLSEKLDPGSSGLMSSVMSWLSDALGRVLSSSLSLATGLFSGVVNFFIALVFALYILAGKETLGRQVGHLMEAFIPGRWHQRIRALAALIDRTFSGFFAGQCLEACILGFLFFVAMSIFRLPYAVLIAVLVGFTALIPVFGAFIGCVVGALLILVHNPMQAVFFVVLFLVLQQLEGNLIYPRVVGSSVGLPAIWVLLAVTMGGSTFGVVGMLLFIPGMSVCYALLRSATRRRLKKKASVEKPSMQDVSKSNPPKK